MRPPLIYIAITESDEWQVVACNAVIKNKKTVTVYREATSRLPENVFSDGHSLKRVAVWADGECVFTWEAIDTPDLKPTSKSIIRRFLEWLTN